MHPDYSENDKIHDIALLRLNEPLKFNNLVKPACLYTNENDLMADTTLTVIGFGTQNETCMRHRIR